MKINHKSRYASTLILLFFSIIFQFSHPFNIIVDLGDVLIETNEKELVWHMGPYNLMQYALNCFISEGRCDIKNSLQRKLFNFLELLKPTNKFTKPLAYGSDGIPLPPLLCDWLIGKKSTRETYKLIQEGLKKHTSFFLNKTEKAIIKKITDLMFTPHIFIKSRSRILPMWNFVQSCKIEGHKIFLLSNWDTESYELLKKKFSMLNSLVDGEVISGKVGILKPDIAIYKHLIKEYDLDPSVSIVIDDQLENLKIAQSLGMHTFHFDKNQPIDLLYEWFNNLQKKVNHTSRQGVTTP